MEISSCIHEDVPGFHSIDRQWCLGNVITFNFLPENKSDAGMYIAGLIPFLKVSQDSWFLQILLRSVRMIPRICQMNQQR
jgi:hypothetical protein